MQYISGVQPQEVRNFRKGDPEGLDKKLEGLHDNGPSDSQFPQRILKLGRKRVHQAYGPDVVVRVLGRVDQLAVAELDLVRREEIGREVRLPVMELDDATARPRPATVALDVRADAEAQDGGARGELRPRPS